MLLSIYEDYGKEICWVTAVVCVTRPANKPRGYHTLHAFKVSCHVLAKLIVPSHMVRSIQIIIHS